MSTQTCAKKKVYYTKSQAIKGLKSEGERVGHRLYYYQCPYCNWYHLSHSDHEKKLYVIKSAGIRFFA